MYPTPLHTHTPTHTKQKNPYKDSFCSHWIYLWLAHLVYNVILCIPTMNGIVVVNHLLKEGRWAHWGSNSTQKTLGVSLHHLWFLLSMGYGSNVSSMGRWGHRIKALWSEVDTHGQTTTYLLTYLPTYLLTYLHVPTFSFHFPFIF